MINLDLMDMHEQSPEVQDSSLITAVPKSV